MAQIPRPPKQGNVTTYVAKVAAGYGRILAGEVDADLDTIYGAWNGGADTVNLRDGAVTSAKLAADSVGPRELQDGGIITTNLGDASVTTPKIADGAVTDPKIVSVAWAKVTATPTTAWGPASGDLSGSYPAPSIRDGAVTTAKLVDASVTTIKIGVGAVTQYNIGDGQVTTTKLPDAAVTRPKLAPGALPGALVTVAITGFSTSVQGQWIAVATLPGLTTRGANPVLLFTNHGLGGVSSASPGYTAIRWVRNGGHVTNTMYSPNAANISYPVPSLPWLDVVPAAGTYTYELQVFLGTGTLNVQFGGGVTGCGLLAVELG
jgi:hypothetical protein